MINQLLGLFFSQRQLPAPWQLPLTSIVISLGLTANPLSLATAAPMQQGHGTNNLAAATTSLSDNQSASVKNGTYLYGQSSEAEQIGKEYIVFEARQGQVIGALYLPHSEFSCFYGTIDSSKMNLTVANPYDQTALSHTIAREQQSPVAYSGNQLNLENNYDSLTYPHAVQLEGYQEISRIGDNDRRILDICVGSYQQQVWN